MRNSILAGFMRCSKPNSPVGSHQCADSREKCAISSSEMVLVARGPSRRLGREDDSDREDAGDGDEVGEPAGDGRAGVESSQEVLEDTAERSARGLAALRASMVGGRW